MQVTIEISDEVMLQIDQTGFSLQELVMEAIEKHTNKRIPLLQTQTWQLCGGLQVKNNLNQPTQSDLETTTNYAENIDDVLYGNW
jgi:hypothetical protein